MPSVAEELEKMLNMDKIQLYKVTFCDLSKFSSNFNISF